MDIKRGLLTTKPNYSKIPVTICPMNDEGARDFNEFYKHVRELGYRRLKRTHSGGICTKGLVLPAWDISHTSTSVEIILIDLEGSCRVQFRHNLPEYSEDKISGREAMIHFKKHLEKYGIDLEAYSDEDGYKYKEEIERPLIRLSMPQIAHKVFTNVHHIDFHNSYPAGLCNTHEEFRPAVEELYLKRRENDKYKAILNLSIGFMQSKWCGYKWARLSRDAINDNNARIKDLAAKLRDSGHFILSYNTDGIWYTGDIYHGEGEGDDLGEWCNDHTFCRWRAKSDGAYEFVEGGMYTPVVRGCQYDRYKPKSEWVWGDIYREFAEVVEYKFIEEEGIFRNGHKV